MKKSRIWLIVSILCIVAGFILLLCSGVRNGNQLGWVLQRAGNAEMQEERTVEVTERFRSLRVSEFSADVQLLPSGDKSCRVVYGESEHSRCKVSVEKGTLTVTREVDSGSGRGIVIFENELPVKIYLPAGSYDKLEIDSTSGNVSADRGFSWMEAEIRTASGDIELEGFDAEELRLKSTSGEQTLKDSRTESLQAESASGDMKLKQCSLGSCRLQSTSGEQTLKECVVAGELKLGTASGDIELEETEAGSMDITGTSSEVRLTRINCDGEVKVETASGDIRLRNAKAESFTLQTSSGDVKGSVLGTMDFIVDSASGSIRTRGGVRGAAPCRVKTASGDVDLDIDG